MRAISEKGVAFPKGFTVNPKLGKLLSGRVKAVETKGMLEWASAEMLAFGSLLWEETLVRLSGQDVRRGTFSHRHAVAFDYNTAHPFKLLLNTLDPRIRPRSMPRR